LQIYIDEMKALQAHLLHCSNSADDLTKCNLGSLKTYTTRVDTATAILTIIQDNFKALQTVQTAIATSYTTPQKIQHDFEFRRDHGLITVVSQAGAPNGIIVQDLNLAPDYGATDSGTISCSTDTSPAVATTDAINFSILYQNVPALTVSAGLLVTFLQKLQYGQESMFDGPASITTANPNGTFSSYFRVTDSARASVFPMAYVNYRIGPPFLKRWWGQPNNEMVFSNNVSVGIGVNSNTGTN
jgi:hypothetical protein